MLQTGGSGSLDKQREKPSFSYEYEVRLLSRIGAEIGGLEKEAFLRNLLLKLSRDPKLPNLWFSLGLTLSDAEMYAAANEAYNMVARLDPAHKKLWNAKAVALSRLGKNHEATHCFQKSLECFRTISNKGKSLIKCRIGTNGFNRRRREDAAARRLITRLRLLEEYVKRIRNN